jgi:hypothetical protein
MSLLFCTMIANAMFYRSEENASAKAGRIELGPIKFSTSQVNLFIKNIIYRKKIKKTVFLYNSI